MNQCDGYIRRLPKKGNLHFVESKPEMMCMAHRYEAAFDDFMAGFEDEETLDFTHDEPLENVSINMTITEL